MAEYPLAASLPCLSDLTSLHWPGVAQYLCMHCFSSSHEVSGVRITDNHQRKAQWHWCFKSSLLMHDGVGEAGCYNIHVIDDRHHDGVANVDKEADNENSSSISNRHWYYSKVNQTTVLAGLILLLQFGHLLLVVLGRHALHLTARASECLLCFLTLCHL